MVFFVAALVVAQVDESKSSNESPIQVVSTVATVLQNSGISFKEGLLAYEDRRFADAGEKFNKSIEVFLTSAMNIKSEPKLQGCYDQLIETVYRIEFPFKSQSPQISEVVTRCEWKLDDQLIERSTRSVLQNATQQHPLSGEEKEVFLARKNLDETRQEFDAKETLLTALLITHGQTEEPRLELAKKDYDQARIHYIRAHYAYSQLRKRFPPIKDSPTMGFTKQTFIPSPLDDLAKPVLPEKKQIERNSVVPYSKSTLLDKPISTIVVRAKAGDTVAKIAARYRVSGIGIAKFNGLLPNTVLGAGREIRIPREQVSETWQNMSDSTGVSVLELKAANPGMMTPKGKVFVPVSIKGTRISSGNYSGPTSIEQSEPKDKKLLGPKPYQAKDGKVAIVMAYFNESLHDPYSMRIVRWSKVTGINIGNEPYWRVSVKYRAKNQMGAYVLSERIFNIRRNKIVSTFE
ncbi:MAG: LysM peptidoglycan-binding domain-containing protein [Chloracidobacterium sp.]|nr:LysM peptidoglycan-binding domain-containing protein [Chloracidobacterium sp.]